MTAEDFARRRPVSRETLDRLKAYHALLCRWNPAINLVAPASLAAAWDRHFLDSAQIFDLILSRDAGTWVDLGSGGGFPGLVAAILAAEDRPETAFTLVESDQRKAAFLRNAVRETGLSVKVLADRIESVPPLNADILSARALAPLGDLLTHAERHLAPRGVAIFPKGARWSEELDRTLENWRFAYEKHPSTTDPDAVVLKIGEIVRV